ncbi:unnamed protein product, partial [Rotaria sordida]
DDGFEQPIPSSRLDVPPEETVFEFDDGFDVLVHVQKPEILSESKEESKDQPQPIILDDGFSNMMSTTTATESILPSTIYPNPIYETEFPENLITTIEEIRDEFKKMLQRNNYASFTAKDTTLRDYQSKFNDVWERLTSRNFARTKPIFLFNDGPVTMAAKRGGILFLEDLDLPSQAVIERLNS